MRHRNDIDVVPNSSGKTTAAATPVSAASTPVQQPLPLVRLGMRGPAFSLHGRFMPNVASSTSSPSGRYDLTDTWSAQSRNRRTKINCSKFGNQGRNSSKSQLKGKRWKKTDRNVPDTNWGSGSTRTAGSSFEDEQPSRLKFNLQPRMEKEATSRMTKFGTDN